MPVTHERRTWLIQRLEQPHGPGVAGQLLNSMAFGGGGSGLSKQAMDLLSQCFSFDYMGAAEFEFGALPKSLQPFVRDATSLVASPIVLKPTEYADGFERRWKLKQKGPPKEQRTVYLLCRKDDRPYVESVVRRCAMNEQHLCEPSCLPDALDRVPGDSVRTCGWYELDNGFFFFTDRVMWERTSALFGVSAPDSKAA